MTVRSLLARASSVVVIEGAGFDATKRRRHRELAKEGDAAAVALIADLLTSHTDAEPMAWMEWPAVSVVFLADREVLIELGLLAAGEWVRYPETGDYRLVSPDLVASWLSLRGVGLGST